MKALIQIARRAVKRTSSLGDVEANKRRNQKNFIEPFGIPQMDRPSMHRLVNCGTQLEADAMLEGVYGLTIAV